MLPITYIKKYTWHNIFFKILINLNDYPQLRATLQNR